jgi:hypothetical protein
VHFLSVQGDELEDEEDEEAREGPVGAEDEEAMPRSMADIYRISNRNRRRNKVTVHRTRS